MRKINVFLSSSLKHTKARDIIKNAFEHPAVDDRTSNEDVIFTVYRHEYNGETGIVKRVNSQYFISAEADAHHVFVLYVGDCIGHYTLKEFKEALHSDNWNYKFIYVLHNPDDILKRDPSKPHDYYMEWADFEKEYMTGENGAIYFEDQKSLPELKEDILNIRSRLASMCLIPISPQQLKYQQVVPSEQKIYREKAFDYIQREDVDHALGEAFSLTGDSFTRPLTIVSGMSLAGKTRSVVHALRQLPASGFRIHFLRGLSTSSVDLLNNLNLKKQFYENWHHVLFIDEFTRLLSFHDEKGMQSEKLKHKFFELMNFAHANPSRLTVVGTTTESYESVRDGILRLANSEEWTERIEKVEVPTMSAQFMLNLFRRLRCQNKVSKDMLNSIKDGMPLGALFIDLRSLKREYELLYNPKTRTQDTLYLRCIFDGIKTVWMWRIHQRANIDLLLDFINNGNHIPTDRQLTEKKFVSLIAETDLNKFIRKQESADGWTPEYFTEQILVDEIFTFLTPQNGEDPKICALRRLVDFILEFHDTEKYEYLHKLVNHIKPTKTLPTQREYSFALEYIESKLSLEKILEHHLHDMQGSDGSKDWAELLASHIVRGHIHRDGFEKALRQINQGSGSDMTDRQGALDRSHSILAVFVEMATSAEDWDMLQPSLFSPGGSGLRPDIQASNSMELLCNLVDRLEFEDALSLFQTVDVKRIINRRFGNTESDENIRKREGSIICRMVNSLLLKATCRAMLLQILEAMESKNKEANAGDPCRWFDFDDKLNLYLKFIQKHTWLKMSENITSFDLPALFDLVIELELPKETGAVRPLLLRKVEILNYLLKPMSFFPAAERWNKMADIRDSFTLRTMLEKCKDYPVARTFYDQFFTIGFGKKTESSPLFLNILVKSMSMREDIMEILPLYRRFGVLEEAKPGVLDRYEMIFDVRDKFTGRPDKYLLGSLMDKDADMLPYDKKVEMLRASRDDSQPREIEAISKIVRSAPDFNTAEDILFGDTKLDFISEDERLMLRKSSFGLTNLCEKVSSRDEAAKCESHLRRELMEAKKEGTLDSLLDVENASILNAVLNNSYIVESYEEAIQKINELTEFAGFDPTNNFSTSKLCKVAAARGPQDMSDRIKLVNSLIIRHHLLPRKNMRQMTRNRFITQFKLLRRKKEPMILPYDELWKESLFPIADTSGKWAEKSETLYGWTVNMMENRFLHPGVFDSIIKSMAKNMTTCSDNAESIALFRHLVRKAQESSMSLNHDSMVKCRKFLKQANVDVDLRSITADYSITKDLISMLETGQSTPHAAMSMLKEYEAEYGPVHRASSLYVCMVAAFSHLKWRKQDPLKISVREILQFMRDSGFSDVQIGSNVILNLLYCVSDYSDFEAIKDLYPQLKTQSHLYVGIRKAVWNCRSVGKRHDAHRIASDVLLEDGSVNLEIAFSETDEKRKVNLHANIITMLSFIIGYDFRKIAETIKRHDLIVGGNAAATLACLIGSPEDYEELLGLTGRPLKCREIRFMINMITSAKKTIGIKMLLDHIESNEIISQYAIQFRKERITDSSDTGEPARLEKLFRYLSKVSDSGYYSQRYKSLSGKFLKEIS